MTADRSSDNTALFSNVFTNEKPSMLLSVIYQFVYISLIFYFAYILIEGWGRLPSVF